MALETFTYFHFISSHHRYYIKLIQNYYWEEISLFNSDEEERQGRKIREFLHCNYFNIQ